MGPGRNGGSSGGYSALAVPKTTLARPCLFYRQVSSHACVVFISWDIMTYLLAIYSF